MSIPWNDEPYLVMYNGYTHDDYLTKQGVTPWSEASEANYAQWKANWEALKYQGKSGKRRARYFILPKTEAEGLPGQLSDWEIEARSFGLKDGAEYLQLHNALRKYYPGIKDVTVGTRMGWTETMAEAYDTYRDEVVDVGGTPDTIDTFVKAIVTNPESWNTFKAQAGPLVAALKAERRKKKKERRKKRLTTLVAIIAVVAFAIFLGPAIVSGVQSVIGGGTSAITALTTLPATTGLTAALTSLGVPAAMATALTASAVEAVSAGAKKDDVADAVADVALDYIPPAGPSSPRPASPSAGLSTPVIVGLAAGGLTLVGLVIWATSKPKRKKPRF